MLRSATLNRSTAYFYSLTVLASRLFVLAWEQELDAMTDPSSPGAWPEMHSGRNLPLIPSPEEYFNA